MTDNRVTYNQVCNVDGTGWSIFRIVPYKNDSSILHSSPTPPQSSFDTQISEPSITIRRRDMTRTGRHARR